MLIIGLVKGIYTNFSSFISEFRVIISILSFVMSSTMSEVSYGTNYSDIEVELSKNYKQLKL